ncbi:MAG: hypothetical protein WBB27_06535, partial [Maribacter sp.]
MSKRNCLVLTQYREGTTYNDFVGKYYHFPQSYLNQFDNLPIEFIYYEPQKLKEGKGEFFGYGKIKKAPFKDKREDGFYFAEIEEYKPFAAPVGYKDSEGNIIEELRSANYNSGNSVRRVPSD